MNIDRYNYIKESDFFWLERDDTRSVEETMQLVEQHFGWSLLDNLSIRKVDAETPLNDELLQFIENCSWDEVKSHLTDVVRKNAFTDWETFFVAMIDGKIVGMVSVMKEDYYPLPEVSPWVSSVFVTEGYRGHRISGKLIEYANDYLACLGFRRSFIPSEHVGLYEKFGYHYITEITNYGGGTDHLYEKFI